MTTGARMKAQRKLLGIPIENIATALGVSVATVYRYENGEIEKVPGSILEPLAKVLQTTPAYLMGEENIEEYVNCPKSIRADFALTCKGDSMINARIFDGDVVYIRQQKTVNNGEIAAVMIEGEATLKRVRLFQDHIVLEPENPLYKPFVYWNDEMQSVQIIGKAVAFTSTVR